MKKIVSFSFLYFSLFLMFVISCSKNPEFTFKYSGGSIFKGSFEASNLKAKTNYDFCLQGKPGRPGNDILLTFDKNNDEGFYNFLTVKSDGDGKIIKNFELPLPTGSYDVKFGLKRHPKYIWIEVNPNVKFQIN
jgi:hypothetical protein